MIERKMAHIERVVATFPIGQTHDGREIVMIPPSVWIAIKKNIHDLEEKLLQTK